MLDKRKFYIDGKWVDPLKPHDLSVLNPATEKPFAVITMGTAADIDRAVAAARKAFASYSRTSVEERIALLEKLLAVYKRCPRHPMRVPHPLCRSGRRCAADAPPRFRRHRQ